MSLRFTKQKRLNEIISELNDLVYESEELEGFGAIELDIALDYRADAWEGEGDCPEPTPEELAEIEAQCDRNYAKISRIEHEQEKLLDEYVAPTGVYPHLYTMSGTYARSWHEKDIPEGESGWAYYD